MKTVLMIALFMAVSTLTTSAFSAESRNVPQVVGGEKIKYLVLFVDDPFKGVLTKVSGGEQYSLGKKYKNACFANANKKILSCLHPVKFKLK